MRNDFISDYLAHSAAGKTWSNHRYIAKVKLASGKWFYFYDTKTYQNYLKRQGGGTQKKSQIPEKDYGKTTEQIKSSLTVSSQNTAAVKNQLASKNTTTNANKKTASQVTLSETKDKQAVGKAAAQNVLSKSSSSTDDTKTKKSSSSSDKSSSKKSGSSSSSSKSSGSSSKSKGSSSSSKSKSSSTKEKSSSSGKSSSSKTTKEESSSSAKKTSEVTHKPLTLDNFKSMFNISDSDVKTHTVTGDELKTEMENEYKDGSFGYLLAGDKTYRWTMDGGEIKLMDFDTGEEVSFEEYFKDATEVKEFRTDNAKKKK